MSGVVGCDFAQDIQKYNILGLITNLAHHFGIYPVSMKRMGAALSKRVSNTKI